MFAVFTYSVYSLP